MKKLFIGVALMLSAMAVNAQIGQGKLFINGEFGVSSTSYENDDNRKSSTLSITPSLGYFLNDQFALGLGVGVASVTNKYRNTRNNPVNNTTSTVSIAPFVRYYVPTGGDKFHFFAQSRLGFEFNKNKDKETVGNQTFTEETKYNTLNFAISPGFAYFPSDHWSVELLLRGLYIDQNNPTGNSKETIVSLNVNSLSPFVGISYFF